MEAIRELIPFVLGALVIAPILGLSPLGKTKTLVHMLVLLILSAVVGFLGSTLVGEQQPVIDLPERVVALVIDTSLAFTGAQVADAFVWKRLLAALRPVQS